MGMTVVDLLIRDVPDEVVAVIDGDAHRLGLSRSEYLRRTLARAAARTSGAVVTVDNLRRFGVLSADLADGDVMRQAWR